MRKFAAIWTTDQGYFPGTNASLNALEHYGNDIDVYVLTWRDFLSEDYKAQWPNVQFSVIDNTPYPGKSAGWYFRFMDFDFALKNLFDKYEAVLFWSADQCVVNNIMKYFEVCAKSGMVILGTNEHGNHSREFVSLSKESPYQHTWSVPYTDQPVFIPANDTRLIEEVLNQQVRREYVSRMDGLNYAVRDLGLNILEVPGELWIQNVPYVTRLKYSGGKVYLGESSSQLFAFHRRYWNTTVCSKYLPGQDDQSRSISKANKMLFNRLYNFFNRECRVPWTEGLEAWDGR